VPISGYRRRDAYIPLPQLGEGLVAAGMNPDDANALVLDALRSGQLLAEGCREHRFDDQPARGPFGDQEQIRRSWWRGFKADEFGRAGAFSAMVHAVGYHIEEPSPELLEAMVKAGLIDRVNDPITGAAFRRQWTAYHAICVEPNAAAHLIRSFQKTDEGAPEPGISTPIKRGPQSKVIVSEEGLYLAKMDAFIANGWPEQTAARALAPIAIEDGNVTIDGRPAINSSGDDYERVSSRLRERWRYTRKPRKSASGN